MMQKKNRRLSDRLPGELERLAKAVAQSEDRLGLHLEPMTGTMGPPAAFFQRAGLWHLLYEWSPFDPQPDLVHFYHASSPDLLTWTNRGVAVYPDTYFENAGLKAGSLLAFEDRLALAYTGMREDQSGIRTNQSMAWFNTEGCDKWYVPIIKEAPQGFDHLQNPYLYSEGGAHTLLVGGQDQETGLGALLKYRSEDFETWTFEGPVSGLPTFEGPLTHPQVFNLDGQSILTISGVRASAQGQQTFSAYGLGRISGLTFVGTDFKLLDHGFDFSAPKMAQGEDGRAFLMANLADPRANYTEADPLGIRAMALPRQVFIRDKQVCQWPIEEIEGLAEKTFMRFQLKVAFIDDQIRFSSLKHQYALKVEIGGTDDLNQVKVNFFEDDASNERVVLTWNYAKEEVSLDRSKTQRQVGPSLDQVRRAPYHEQNLRLYAICDRSSIEVFLGDGQVVFSSRIYARPQARGISIEIDGKAFGISVKAWTLKTLTRPAYVL